MPDLGPTRFPDGFLWGAATSAYQVEGSPLADGAGPSIWHRFSHTPGRTHENQTGDVACDHYRRYADDVRRMKELGLAAYRFSISWSRVLPGGRGRVNRAGLGFYDRLVDLLLSNGIQPLVTLYHWDLPAALDDLGGWPNPDSAHWFADYARVAFEALDDRVPMWATLNEPWVVVDAGYLFGVHAPGHADRGEAGRAAHNLMRAHGAAVQAYRAVGRNRIGLVVNLEPKEPHSDSPADRAATLRADEYMNRQYLDAALLGRYPAALVEAYAPGWQAPPEADFRLIRQPLDFLGINYYTRGVTRHDDAGAPVRSSTVRFPEREYTAMDWEVAPGALTRCLCRVKELYGDIPLYVTENGAAFPDPARAEGSRVEDPRRVEYLRRHLRAALEAIRLGVDLRGYFAWSLLDNYEWSCGYSMRFGLTHVDFETQERTPKASGEFYREVIRSNGENLGR
ncbi:MAG: beta-glucosidase [Candidatus Eisenbacteria bacterium]|nr:beta-glucosidase [Candidatus Eisenbacteria bacterium]